MLWWWEGEKGRDRVYGRVTLFPLFTRPYLTSLSSSSFSLCCGACELTNAPTTKPNVGEGGEVSEQDKVRGTVGRNQPRSLIVRWFLPFTVLLTPSFFAPYHPLVQLLLLGRERSERTNINNQNGGWKVEKWPSLWFPRFRWFQRSGALGSVRSVISFHSLCDPNKTKDK